MNKILNIFSATIMLCFLGGLMACSQDENDPYTPPKIPEVIHKNDIYNTDRLTKPYGCAVRWRWNDSFIKPTQRATPIADSLVIPISQLIQYLWIEPYKQEGDSGKDFINELFPSELVYIGSYIYKTDGTRLLGYAEGGARITLLNLNNYDLGNRKWLVGVLATLHHEFSHIVHQKHGMPEGFNKISTKYLGSGWSNDVSFEDAVKLGMVTEYGTKNEREDFAEIVSEYLVLPQAEFNELFIELKDDELDEGRKKIKQKLDMILEYYETNFAIDLASVQQEMEKRISYTAENQEIPEL